MSFAKVYSAQTLFLKGTIVDVEVDLSNGMHSFTIVGLGDKSVDESKDRIAAAIKNSGFKSPKVKNQKVVISLAPADTKKEGPAFDVSMAIGYLLAAEEIDFYPEKKLFLGELSLDGNLRKINGILPLIIHAKNCGFTEVFLPYDNAKEAALIKGIAIYGAQTLHEIVLHLNCEKKEKAKKAKDERVKETLIFSKKIEEQPQTIVEHTKSEESYTDFNDIKGQEEAKRGLEIAAAGGHNIALFGPPGTGKTMLAQAFCHILPPLSFDEILEVTSIHSIAGKLKDDLITHPPLRSPHHSSSYTSLIGGGAHPKPGEITLAHKGVLFLDELPEFESRVIDSLRQPLEERMIHITRVKGSASFPAQFILIAAMNPCPCGNFNIEGKNCICKREQVERYHQKISGPIVDRIDIWVEVSKINYQNLTLSPVQEMTAHIKKRVEKARTYQKIRFEGSTLRINSEMKGKDIEKYITLSTDVKKILVTAAERLQLSVRVYHRLIKLARTIADLEEEAEILPKHMLEALQYRPKTRQ